MLDNYTVRTSDQLDIIQTQDIELPYRYRPYPFQAEIIDEFFAMLEGESTKKRFALELHRRAGKDVTFFQLVVAAACMVKGDYAYMLPSAVQAKKIIWNGIVQDSDGVACGFFDFIPPNMAPVLNKSEGRVQLANGSNIYIAGSDNYDSIVGMNLKGVVLSEWSLCNPAVYGYVEPMLNRCAEQDRRTGWCLMCWTPRGFNHSYKTRQAALDPINADTWYFCSKDITQTSDENGKRLISDKAIEEARNGGTEEASIQQEYFLSYDAAVKGIIYAKQLENAREQGRIRKVPINPNKPILTFWDLGMDDETAIWMMQQGKDATDDKLYLVGYYENRDEGVDHYLEYLKRFAINNHTKLGTIYFPHDGKVKEWTSGQRRHHIVASKGYTVEIVPRTSDVNLAIQQTKQIFDRFVFDPDKCFRGIECLDNYRRKTSYDGTLGAPHHNWASNGADALRQIGQFYADKFVDDSYDYDRMSKLQEEMNNTNYDNYDVY